MNTLQSIAILVVWLVLTSYIVRLVIERAIWERRSRKTNGRVLRINAVPAPTTIDIEYADSNGRLHHLVTMQKIVAKEGEFVPIRYALSDPTKADIVGADTIFLVAACVPFLWAGMALALSSMRVLWGVQVDLMASLLKAMGQVLIICSLALFAHALLLGRREIRSALVWLLPTAYLLIGFAVMLFQRN
jgi:hypothetical protein